MHRQPNEEELAAPRMTAIEHFKRQNRYELVKLSCFAAACLLCLFAIPQVNRGCQFESTKFNMAFFYTCILVETTIRLLVRFLFMNDD